MRAILILFAVPLLGAAPAQPQKPATAAPPAKAEGPSKSAISTTGSPRPTPRRGSRSATPLSGRTTRPRRFPAAATVVFTVSQRPSGRDAVAITAGFPYAPNAAVTVQVDQTALEFYTAGRSAFAHDGHAAAAAFGTWRKITAPSPGPRNAQVVRHLQPERLRPRLRGDQQGLPAEDDRRRRAQRGGTRAHPRQNRPLRPARGADQRRPSRSGGPDAGGIAADLEERRGAVPRQAGLALDL